MQHQVRMYRKHGDDCVVDVDNVWPLVPITDPDYVAWLAAGNRPLEQEEVEGGTHDHA